MFLKKDSNRTIFSLGITNQELAEAWSQFQNQYDSLRQRAEGEWSKIQSLGVVNCFIVHHRSLSERFPHDYGKWEKPLVEAAPVNAKEGRPIPPVVEEDFLSGDEMVDKSACWKQLLNTYCQFHGSLRVDWRAWNENEYREFLATIEKLRSAVALANLNGEV